MQAHTTDMKPGGMVSWADYMRQNQVVRGWAAEVRQKIKQSASQFVKGKRGMVHRNASPSGGARDEDKLIRSIKHRVTYKHGISDGVGFRLERHGVFVHKGVGRGYKMTGGMVVRYAKNPPRGPVRVPVDWFNVVIEANVKKLADQIGEINADAAVNAIRMRIK